MIGSLRIMHFGFLISVMVAVLIIGTPRDAIAQGNEVECPCDFDSVPMTTGCWVDQRPVGSPIYIDSGMISGGIRCITESSTPNRQIIVQLSAGFGRGGDGVCRIALSNLNDCNTSTPFLGITPEEVLACQCELLAYTTALNEGGISVSGGPPYVCANVDVRTCQGLPPFPRPIPTLNEYGMIITAGVLGLLAVIGLFVMRTRRTVAGGRSPDGANQ